MQNNCQVVVLKKLILQLLHPTWWETDLKIYMSPSICMSSFENILPGLIEYFLLRSAVGVTTTISLSLSTSCTMTTILVLSLIHYISWSRSSDLLQDSMILFGSSLAKWLLKESTKLKKEPSYSIQCLILRSCLSMNL